LAATISPERETVPAGQANSVNQLENEQTRRAEFQLHTAMKSCAERVSMNRLLIAICTRPGSFDSPRLAGRCLQRKVVGFALKTNK